MRGKIHVLSLVTFFCVGAYGATGIGVSSPGSLECVAPVFTGLSVLPAEASNDQIVEIQFTASEALSSPPSVLVLNSAQATFVSVSGLDYTYTYTVLDTDPLGMTGVSITGTDLVGNPGALSEANVLEIVLPSQHVPLRSWPVALALVAAGLLVLARRSSVSAFVLLALLAAPVAMAAPSVTNVSFLQQPDGAGSTEVRITYDLASSNGPCDITASLSKDGGTDGYAYPVSSVTGDISGVSAGTGRVITWKIAQDYPNEDIPNARLQLLADDGLPPGSGLPVELLSVAAGSFDMGRTSSGDDATYGGSDELPVHTVTLSAYEIGKYEVTNQQFCDVLNYAIDPSRNYLRDGGDAAWSGTGDIYVGADLARILAFSQAECNIQFSAGSFSPKTRVGLPGSTNYSTATHPVVHVSWAGAVYFCNWLSEIEGLTPVYDPTSGWAANFANNGYHLPTEAQWERAAAWDGTKHWTYGFLSDTLSGNLSANAVDATLEYANPLGLTVFPLTSPVGWFDRVNVNPANNAATNYSVSPVGCFDMSGNVWEWCHDEYLNSYYATSPGTDPEGPIASTTRRVFRGGGFGDASPGNARTAKRNSGLLSYVNSGVGFRLARTVEYSLSYSASVGGTLTGNTDQTVLPGDDGTPVEAVPDSEFAFLNWSDGVTDNPRTDTNVSSGITVTANFFEVPEMISVATGSFDMGRTSSGDDATFGGAEELPVHTVLLSAYEIGMFEVTNQQVCDVFNWADDQGFFTTVDATTATAFGQELLDLDSATCYIEYAGGVFQPESRTGDPGGATVYSMADHPAQAISWFGAAVFCNWLSQIEGLTPVYNTDTWAAGFANDGYHLPTEAQWERAAAWDGVKHWTYSFTSDTLTGNARANYDSNNPLGLTITPRTSPVGWFDGSNVNPNGSVATVDSMSPAGAYDMTGNVWEWCHDWYDSGYYAVSPTTDPEGAASGTGRVIRGGAWTNNSGGCRSARRLGFTPSHSSSSFGFRLAR